MNIKDLIEAVKFQVSVRPQDDFMREVAEGLEKLYSDMLSDYDAALRKNNATTEKNSATEMTDNEIKKASELVEKLRSAHDDYYNLKKSMPYDIDTTLLHSAFCLENCTKEINRQKAEIESLIAGQETLQKSLAEKSAEVEKFKKGNDFKKSQIDGLKILLKRADEIKSEAVKEFAERLKEKAFTHERPFEANEDKFIKFVAVESIDNLVKEMVGEK